MTGVEIAKAIRAYKGKVQVCVLFGQDVSYIYAEKHDLIEHFKNNKDETGCEFTINEHGDAYVDTAF